METDIYQHEPESEYLGKNRRLPVMAICHKEEICFVVNQVDFRIILLKHNLPIPLNIINALEDSC